MGCGNGIDYEKCKHLNNHKIFDGFNKIIPFSENLDGEIIKEIMKTSSLSSIYSVR